MSLFLYGEMIEIDEESEAAALVPPAKTQLVEGENKSFLKKRKSFLPRPALILTESKTGFIPELEISAIKSSIALNIFKNISFSLSHKVYPNDPDRDASTDLQLNQSMKLNLKGIVGERLNLLIKYDDTQQNYSINQNISLKYAGKEDEILKSIEAGNINLSIPNTQFVSYSKNFFGLKAKIVFEDVAFIPGKLQLFPIMGISENQTMGKTYRGNTSQTERELNDGGYQKNRLYALYRSTSPSSYAWQDLKGRFDGRYQIVSNSEIIFYDDANGINNDTDAVINIGPLQGGVQIWNFEQLLRGEDYYVDTNRGILFMEKSINDSGLVIAAFQVEDLLTGEFFYVGLPYDPFVDDDGDGMVDEDPPPGTDDDNDGMVDEDPPGDDDADGYEDDDGDGAIDEDASDAWYSGAVSDLDADGNNDTITGYIFLKTARNRFTGNALMNAYSTGVMGIAPDDISVSIINLNDSDNDNTTYTTTTGKVIKYLTIFGLDKDFDGIIDRDREILDTDNGYLFFPDATPFDLTDNDTVSGYLRDMADSERFLLSASELNEIIDACSNKRIYARNDSLTSPFDISQTRFKIQMKYDTPQKLYYLSPNIKEGSEVVKVDGAILKTGTDYTIDYRSGFLTFRNDDVLKGNAQIEINYEYEPFFSSQQKYVLGNRLEWNISPNFFIGSTVISEEYMKGRDEIPKPGEEPESKFVADVDLSLKITEKFLKDTLFKLPLISKLKPKPINISAEYAYSYNNPNTYGEAELDTMEGTKSYVSPTMLTRSSGSGGRQLWYLSSEPSAVSGVLTRAMTISLNSEDTEFNSAENKFRFYHITNDGDSRPITQDDTFDLYSENPLKTSLVIKLDESDSWGGITNCISSSLMDISQRSTLDFWIKNTGAATIATLHIDIGLISEDADADALNDSEDTLIVNGRLDEVDGISEDIGIEFNGFASGPVTYGAGDNYLQKEDLDGNGLVDFADRYYSYSISVPGPNDGNDGWVFYSIPLNLDNPATDTYGNPAATSVKYLRLWVETTSGPVQIKIQDLGISGSQWEKGRVIDGDLIEYFNLSNASKDDPAFGDAFFDEDDITDREALLIDYYITGNSTQPHTGYTEKNESKAINISNYKFFEISSRSVSHFPDTAAYTLYFRMGIDENNYWRFPLAQPSFGSWTPNEVDIKQIDARVADGSYSKEGNPSLYNVKYMAIELETETTIEGRILINNIILKSPEVLRDSAYRAAVSTELPGLGPVSVSYSNVGGNFSSLGSSRTGRDQEVISANLTLNSIKYLPITVGYSSSASTLQEIINISDSGVADYRSESENFRITTNMDLGKLLWSKLPSISYSYSNRQNKAYGIRDEDALLKSNAINEIHNVSVKIRNMLFILQNINISGGRNIVLKKFNQDYDNTDTDSFDARNNATLNFDIKHLKLKNTFVYNDTEKDGFKQNDNMSYNLSTSLKLLKHFLQPNITVKSALTRTYYKSAEEDTTNVKFSTNVSISNRMSLSTIFRKTKFLSLGTININASYDYSTASEISSWAGIFPVEDAVKIITDQFEDEIFNNLSVQERIAFSMNYNPLSFIALSGNYNYRRADTVKLGSSYSDFTHSLVSNASITKLDKFFKFLKRTSLTLGFNYTSNEKSNSNYRLETFTPSATFPINFSSKLNQSLRVSYSHRVETTSNIAGLIQSFQGNLTLSSSWNYRMDLKYGLKIPFVKKKIKLKNSVNTKLAFSMSMLRSDKINATESNNINVNGGFDYRFSKNFVFNSNISYTIYDNLNEVRLDYREFKITFGGNIIF